MNLLKDVDCKVRFLSIQFLFPYALIIAPGIFPRAPVKSTPVRACTAGGS